MSTFCYTVYGTLFSGHRYKGVRESSCQQEASLQHRQPKNSFDLKKIAILNIDCYNKFVPYPKLVPLSTKHY